MQSAVYRLRSIWILASLTCLSISEAGCRRHHAPPAFTPSILPPNEATRRAVAGSGVAAPIVWRTPFVPASARPPAAPEPRFATMDGGSPLVASKTVADGGTVNGDPRGPSPEALNAVIRSSLPRIQQCLESGGDVPPNLDVEVSVSYQLPPTGKPENVAVRAELVERARECVRRTVEDLRFPPFEGTPIAASFPFSYRRDLDASGAPAP